MGNDSPRPERYAAAHVALLAPALLVLAACSGGGAGGVSVATTAPYSPGPVVASALGSAAAASAAEAAAATSAARATAAAASAAAASASAAEAAAHPRLTVDQMRVMTGTPCSTDGAVSIVVEGQSPTYSSTPFDNGITCAAGIWVIQSEALRGCSGEAAALPFITTDGRALACVEGTLYVQGEPISGPLYSGDYEVGTDTGQVAPGTYVATDVENCYWERLDSSGNIIDNNFISAAPRAEFTVRSSDYAINIQGCRGWTLQ